MSASGQCATCPSTHNISSVPENRVGNATFMVREQAAHYALHGFRCRGAVDTSLMLHLEIVDSLGRYRPAEHESSWLIDCRERPGGPRPIGARRH